MLNGHTRDAKPTVQASKKRKRWLMPSLLFALLAVLVAFAAASYWTQTAPTASVSSALISGWEWREPRSLPQVTKAYEPLLKGRL